MGKRNRAAHADRHVVTKEEAEAIRNMFLGGLAGEGMLHRFAKILYK